MNICTITDCGRHGGPARATDRRCEGDHEEGDHEEGDGGALGAAMKKMIALPAVRRPPNAARHEGDGEEDDRRERHGGRNPFEYNEKRRIPPPGRPAAAGSRAMKPMMKKMKEE